MNGNIIKDYNRHMHTPSGGNGAVYNLLDKPDSLVISGKATLYYYYDAGGNTLKKQVKDYTTGITSTYLYLSGFVYLNDTLQYVQMEEGRLRPHGTGFVYDYYLRDHLGNVRTVLTDQKDTAAYMPASLETAGVATERLYYSGVDSGRVNKNTVPGYPSDGYTSPNDYIQQLSGSGFKIGTGIVLKVMAGDQFNIRVSSWYKTNGVTPGTPVSLLTNLLATLTAGVGSITGAHGGATTAQLTSSGVLVPGATDFLTNRAYTSSKPKAYLNWILFDDQFKMVTAGSGAEQVGDDQEFKVHVKSNMPVSKNGYLYVYVSNETPNINVYFDNLQVTHMTGPLLQEQSYYPFGLEMAGISDEALGKLDSKNKFNGGTELQEDHGVNLYSTFFRQYDPQIGRFSGVDCQSEATAGLSVYQFGGNNPVSFNDPLGDKMVAGLWGGSNSAYYNASPFFSYMDQHGNRWHHSDGLLGTASEGMQYQDGFGLDGFGDGGGGGGGTANSGFVTNVKYGYYHGRGGYYIGYAVQGNEGNGHEILAEAKVERRFIATSFGQADYYTQGNAFTNYAMLGPDFENMFGATTTNKVSIYSHKTIYDSHLGDKVTISTYAGKVVGKTGVINQDVSTLDLKKDEYTLTVGPLSFAYSFNGSVTGGINIFGYDIHGGIDAREGLLSGFSHTDEQGNIVGEDVTLRPGFATVAVLVGVLTGTAIVPAPSGIPIPAY